MKRQILIAAMAAIALLGGCGGGGGGDEEPRATPNEVPDSALGSATAYTTYVGSLAASETALPVDISKITSAPTSEIAPPAAI